MRPADAASTSPFDLAGYRLEITVEDGYLKAYAQPPDGAGIISYGLQGRVRDDVFDNVRKLVDEYLEAQRV